jgi:hypothetical protein
MVEAALTHGLNCPHAIVTLARFDARNAVKARLRDQGYKLRDLRVCEIELAARAYLSQHPELLEAAAESISRYPDCSS